MGLINLEAYPRATVGKNENRRTRVAGRTPANIYGNERTEAMSLELDTVELKKALLKGGRNPLFNLSIAGEDCVAMVREMQKHPVTDIIFHMDLLEIPLGQPMQFEVAIDYVGDNKKVRGGDAILDIMRRSIEVECLPRKLPESLELDISELEIGDRIAIEDLKMEDVTILTELDETLCKLSPNTIIALEDEVTEGEEDEAVEGEEAAEGDEAPAEDSE
jgi:large subunit ribosomal protein L25